MGESPAFVKNLQNLQFDGTDKFFLFGNRPLGVGPFSMSPSASWGEKDSGKSAEYSVYEETESMHGPNDRAAMTAMSMNCATIPREISGMFRVVDHLASQVEILFSHRCPLVAHLHELVSLVREGSCFVDYRPHDFTVFIWSLHSACREFFRSKTMFIIQRLTVDIRGRLTLSAKLPRELQDAPTQQDPRRSNDGPSEYTLPGMQSSNKRPKNGVGSLFAHRFRYDLERAAAKTRPHQFMAHQLCRGNRDMKTLFGPEFMALMPRGKPPCIKYFIFGNCHHDTECRASHTVSSEPSVSIVGGIVKRVKAVVEALLQKD